jgi:aspartyl-tRNA(Asn)/glutamyl-tRNA(Gln) amidotransferase subunit B
MDALTIAPSALAEMISLIEDNTISGKIAKDILPDLLEGRGNAGVKVSTSKGRAKNQDTPEEYAFAGAIS